MTTLDELCSAVGSIGLPWTNTAWIRGDDPEPPYVVLTRTGAETVGGDDMTWCVVAEYDVELYTAARDYAREKDVREALDAAGIYYNDGGVWPIPEESMFEAVYTVTVREN